MDGPLDGREVSPSGIHFINLFIHEPEQASSLNLPSPGKAMKRHYHEHGINIFHITSGEGELYHGTVNSFEKLSNEEALKLRLEISACRHSQTPCPSQYGQGTTDVPEHRPECPSQPRLMPR